MGRVLVLTQVLPYPLNAGPKIRAYYVLRHLARRHQVTLVSFVRSDDLPEYVAHLQDFCEAVHTVPMRRSLRQNLRALARAALSRLPVVILRDELPEMQALIRQLVTSKQYDAVHADQMSMAQYGLYASQQAGLVGYRPRTILDAHNALYRVFERLSAGEQNVLKRALFWRESRALRRYEWATVKRYDKTVCVTEEDRHDLQPDTEQPAEHFQVIPICIDPKDRQAIAPADRQPLVTHMGTMFWPPNIEGVAWFTKEVWPLVAAESAEARLVIIGKRPPEEILALGEGNERIDVLGYVDDPAGHLAETAAFIVPLHSGAGMRVKIIDAWCWGVPIVSTTVGAEGILIHDGANLLLADDPGAFARAVVRLLEDESLRQRMRENGRDWVSRRYDWRSVYVQWDEVYGI